MRWSMLVGAFLAIASPLARPDPPLSFAPWIDGHEAPEHVSLEGNWQASFGCVNFTPLPGQQHSYDVTIGDCGGEPEFRLTATLHQLDGLYLIVVGPTKDRELLTAPVYWLMKAELDDDTLNVFDVDGESFEHRVASSSIEFHDGLVLSETEQLVEFLSWQVGDPSFFEAEHLYALSRIEVDE
jgi:hypothetical protein